MANINPELQEQLDLINKRLDGIEQAVETAAKIANDAADASPGSPKKQKAVPPVEFSIGKKNYRAKGNKYMTQNGKVKVDLVGMTDAELKKAYEETPTMFVEVD